MCAMAGVWRSEHNLRKFFPSIKRVPGIKLRSIGDSTTEGILPALSKTTSDEGGTKGPSTHIDILCAVLSCTGKCS